MSNFGSKKDYGFTLEKTDFATSAGELSEFAAATYRRLKMFSYLFGVTVDTATIGAICAVTLALAIERQDTSPNVSDTWLAQAPVVGMVSVALCFCTIIALCMRGHYNRPVPFLSALRQLYGVAFYAFLTNLIVIMGSAAPPSWRWLPLIWLVIPLAILSVREIVTSIMRKGGLDQRRVLIVGSETGIGRLVARSKSNRLNGYQIAATLDAAYLAGMSSATNVPAAAPVRASLDRVGADFLVISLDGCDAELRSAIMDLLARETVPFGLIPDFVPLPLRGSDTFFSMFHTPTMWLQGDNFHHSLQLGLKWAFDRLAALIMLLILLPILVVISVAVAIDGGPVFFSQTRIGQHGRRFGCLKFRSMIIDADQALSRLLATDPDAAAEWRQTRKLRNDPRITRVGRLLRKTSIDELPQLLNVLRGEMSLVGPRPVVEVEIERYGSDADLYCRCKPGITGLWQVCGRSNTTYAQRVALDAWYVKNWSLWHDIVILAKTVPALLQRSGAV